MLLPLTVLSQNIRIEGTDTLFFYSISQARNIALNLQLYENCKQFRIEQTQALNIKEDIIERQTSVLRNKDIEILTINQSLINYKTDNFKLKKQAKYYLWGLSAEAIIFSVLFIIKK